MRKIFEYAAAALVAYGVASVVGAHLAALYAHINAMLPFG